MSIQELEYVFNEAQMLYKKYIAVVVRNLDYLDVEVIINGTINFTDKLEHYKKAYDENLKLKSYDKIQILNCVFGDSYEEIQEKLKV